MYRHLEHFTFVFYQTFLNRFVDYFASMFNLLYTTKYFTTQYRKTNLSTTETKIPKQLFLCYKHKRIPSKIIYALQQHNPHYKITLFDDKECSEFIHKKFGKSLGDVFDNIKDGPIKADLFRVCILYENGGVYSDIDNTITRPIDDIIQPGVTFGIGASHQPNQLNPAFLFTTKKNPLLLEFIECYNNVICKIPYAYWDYSIVYVSSYVLQSYMRIENKSQTIQVYNQSIQLFKEEFEYSLLDVWCFMINPNHNLLKYVYLYNHKNEPIIQLHSELYDSGNHSFIE